MLGRTASGGLTTSIPRKIPQTLNSSATCVVVEGKIDLTEKPDSKWCQSSIRWSGEAQPDFAKTLSKGTKFVDFRHSSLQVMDILYMDQSVRSVRWEEARSSMTQTNWDGR
jgi:hypothetical protein